MTFHIITLFPDMFSSYLHESILARAIDAKKIYVNFYNPRDYSKDKHKKTDDKPYGGGPGMVMSVQPIVDCVADIKKRFSDSSNQWKIFITSPGGKHFTNVMAKKLTQKHKHIIVICGRYEGIDSRVKKILRAQEISVGDYVLTGGELPAMIMIDAIARQVKGVLGKEESLEEKRISSHEMYTRPEVFVYNEKKYKVPAILLSGDHKKIDEYRKNSI